MYKIEPRTILGPLLVAFTTYAVRYTIRSVVVFATRRQFLIRKRPFTVYTVMHNDIITCSTS